tara:strand:+ start:1417 stop:4416 length:3000 start_codon:yes stop_codon:yes gene_type:complete
MELIILDCIRGRRRLDQRKSLPNSLTNLDNDSTVLDWINHFATKNQIPRITYIGGYQIQKVIQSYPEFNFLYHQNWNSTGEASGLTLMKHTNNKDLIVIRATSVLLPEALQSLNTDPSKICIAQNNYHLNEPEFSGVIYVPQTLRKSFMDHIFNIASENPESQLEDVINNLPPSLPFLTTDVNGLVAPIDKQLFVAQTIFQGKAQTLEQVRPLLKSATVLEQYKFSYQQWVQNPDFIMKTISEQFINCSVIVRSTSSAEDNLNISNAGIFKTIQGIPPSDKQQINQAISDVFNSYATVNLQTLPNDEVFIQQYQTNLTANGVIFTRDLESAAPYMLINIDRNTGVTDGVTSGNGADIETIYINKKLLSEPTDYEDNHIKLCVALVKELETLTNLSDLDIEFGISDSDELYLFQLRPISSKARKYILEDEDLFEQLDNIQQFIQSISNSDKIYAGSFTLLGTMTDWNPIEMLGTTPRPLALSLYQRLIGRSSWSKSRAQLGYTDMGEKQLIQSLGGVPYVNIKLSLNSLLPASIHQDTAHKWINHCLYKLQINPELHDKIEFELTPTCLDSNFDDYASDMNTAGLTENEILHFKKSLTQITEDIISGHCIQISKELEELQTIEDSIKTWSTYNPQSITELSNKISHLLSECENPGTLVFAKLARCAFVAISILKSLVKTNILSESELTDIYKSIPTIASEMSNDMANYQTGDISLNVLLRRYGHLRPSSYDITSDNYKNGYHKYFGPIQDKTHGNHNKTMLSDNTESDAYSILINKPLHQLGLQTESEQLIHFIIQSIQARELAKFEFMKLVNEILESVATLGEIIGFSRNDLSYLNINDFERLASESPSPAIKADLIRIKQYQEKKWNLTCHTKLPHLIGPSTNISYFKALKTEPNYISGERITAAPIILDNSKNQYVQLDGKIVLISSADPGYDWIFSHNISGLITEYGGAASHMSIRAAEFGIPAAIGCGTTIYSHLKSFSIIELDCVNKIVRGITC